MIIYFLDVVFAAHALGSIFYSTYFEPFRESKNASVLVHKLNTSTEARCAIRTEWGQGV